MDTKALHLRGRLALALVACGAICASVALADEPTSAQRFQLSGSGTLTLDAPPQQGGSLLLKAALLPDHVTAQRVQQSGGPFALTATLAPSSLVCYNDTIFRDDFDGDGF